MVEIVVVSMITIYYLYRTLGMQKEVYQWRSMEDVCNNSIGART